MRHLLLPSCQNIRLICLLRLYKYYFSLLPSSFSHYISCQEPREVFLIWRISADLSADTSRSKSGSKTPLPGIRCAANHLREKLISSIRSVSPRRLLRRRIDQARRSLPPNLMHCLTKFHAKASTVCRNMNSTVCAVPVKRCAADKE